VRATKTRCRVASGESRRGVTFAVVGRRVREGSVVARRTNGRTSDGASSAGKGNERRPRPAYSATRAVQPSTLSIVAPLLVRGRRFYGRYETSAPSLPASRRIMTLYGTAAAAAASLPISPSQRTRPATGVLLPPRKIIYEERRLLLGHTLTHTRWCSMQTYHHTNETCHTVTHTRG